MRLTARLRTASEVMPDSSKTTALTVALRPGAGDATGPDEGDKQLHCSLSWSMGGVAGEIGRTAAPPPSQTHVNWLQRCRQKNPSAALQAKAIVFPDEPGPVLWLQTRRLAPPKPGNSERRTNSSARATCPTPRETTRL